jgi:hypothetical protein
MAGFEVTPEVQGRGKDARERLIVGKTHALGEGVTEKQNPVFRAPRIDRSRGTICKAQAVCEEHVLLSESSETLKIRLEGMVIDTVSNAGLDLWFSGECAV